MSMPTVVREQPGTPSDQRAPDQSASNSQTFEIKDAVSGHPGTTWHGAQTPDACFALVSRTPLGFYRWMDGHGAGAGATRTARTIAAETGCAPGAADLIDLLNTLAAMSADCREAAERTAAWLADRPDAGTMERAAKVLNVFEAACADPEPVRAFERRWGPFGHVGWLVRHADLYEALDEQGDDLLRRMDETVAETVTSTDAVAGAVAQTRAAPCGAQDLYDEVRAAAEASPYLACVGIMEPQTHLAARTQAAHFSDEFYGIPVPSGYLDEMIAASRGDESACEHALTTLRGVHGARLNRAAARQAFEYAQRLDDLASHWKPRPLEGAPAGTESAASGRAEIAHFSVTLLYVTLALIAACAWPYVADALAAQARFFAGSEWGSGLGAGALAIPDVHIRALCELALIGLASAASAVAVRRLFELGRHRSVLERARQIRATADDLRADGAVLATGADAVKGRRVRIDVEEYLCDLVIEEPVDDEQHGGSNDGRFCRRAFWVGAAVCATSIGLASIGSVPFVVAGIMGIEMPGLLSLLGQAAYVLLGVAAFVGVARVRPVQDPLTLALLACAPILPYFAVVGLALTGVVGLACVALNRLFRLP